METAVQYITNEVADNWPAFVYILMTIVFSFFFFRQRRAEARLVRDIGEGIRDNIELRLDRLESLVRQSAARQDSGTPELKARAAKGNFSS